MSAGPAIGRGFERTPRSCIVASPMASNWAGVMPTSASRVGSPSPATNALTTWAAGSPGRPISCATSAWRSGFTSAFQASTAGRATHDVSPCGTP